MARRKSKAKQQEEWYKSLFGLAGFGSFFGTYWMTKQATAAIVVAITAIAFVIAFIAIRHYRAIERLKKSGIEQIDQMDGIEFEKYLGHLFRSQGYEVKVTQDQGDFGADLILVKSGMKTVVQAKRYSKNVGIKAVQEAQTAIAHYGAAQAWVITNSDYTAAAYELAMSNQVRLINRESLIDMILAVQTARIQQTPKTKALKQEYDGANKQVAVTKELESDSSTEGPHLCDLCNSPLVLRNGPKGSFYGCSRFPKCRFTKAIADSN